MPRNNTPTTLPSPFTPAGEKEAYLKALLFGPPGSGKTWAALEMHTLGPVAVFDTEGGTAFYGKKFPFSVQTSKSYSDLVAAVDWIEKNPGAVKVFVIDPITVIYETLQDAAHKARVVKAHKKAERERTLADFDPDNVDLEMLDWGRIKRNYSALMNRLVNLPAHVVVTARQKDITEKRGQEMVKVGIGPDAEKRTTYLFDVVLRLEASLDKRAFVVDKDRTGTLPLGSRHPGATLAGLYAPLISGKPAKDATPRHVADDDEAASRDSGGAMGEELAGAALAAEFAAALVAAGYDPEEVRHNRGWLPFAAMPKATIGTALEALRAKQSAPGTPPAPPAATETAGSAPEGEPEGAAA